MKLFLRDLQGQLSAQRRYRFRELLYGNHFVALVACRQRGPQEIELIENNRGGAVRECNRLSPRDFL